MIAHRDDFRLSPQDYLDWEAQQPIKYEYINGEAYAMTGGTLPHNDIAVNLTTLLKAHLRGKRCKVRMSDAKVGITEQGPFFYPDVVVSCDERDRTAIKMVRYPCLIIEVLSPSTEGYDRGEKFRRYRQLDSLQEYVVVECDRKGVDCYRRSDRGTWELSPYTPDDLSETSADDLEIHLTSIDFRCPLSLVYEDVEVNLAVPELNGADQK
ncbi:MAG: Uma2 family endonuclease [Myxacorys californica WJT36-NPBG1]|jgi:Uma2 family endonuclease|nr:Uma2 family endonuclease [Myxacorys californica WJT36-NPBG1]